MGPFMPLASTAFQFGMMVVEAQTVIAYRMMGMAGLWATPRSETTRMVAEKMGAFTQASLDASAAAARGGDADAVLRAAIKPIRRKTSANARRLSKRGFAKRR